MSLFFKIIPIVAATFLLVVSPTLAQGVSDANMEILAEKLKADKKLVVAMNMELSEKEADGFWPVYNSYQADLQQVNERMGKIISEYADALNAGSVSDKKAGHLIKEWLVLEVDEMKLRNANVKKLARVLSAQKTMRYLQIESKIRALIRYRIAEEVPLVY